MTETESAWLAGFLDGEGCFQLWCDRASHYNGVLSASGINRDVLERCREIAGGSVFSVGCLSRGANRRPLYKWMCRRSDVERILTAIRPWLIVKAEQADVLLALRALPRQERNAKQKNFPPVALETWDKRELYRLAIAALNHRGSSLPTELQRAALDRFRLEHRQTEGYRR